jgi:hypothetical protein
MAFEQYTTCVRPEDYRKRSFLNMAATAAAVSGALGALATVAGSPWCLFFLLPVFGLVFLIQYCRNWLYERLICLDGDKDVIGMVAGVSPPAGLAGWFKPDWPFVAPDWDNDYSINLLLQNTELGVTQADAETTPPYGELVHPQQVITDLEPETPGYPDDGYETPNPDNPGQKSATLHAEFEGSGNYDLMQISEGLLPFFIAAYLVCLIAPWPISLILAILAALGFLTGALAALLVRPGSPTHTNPDIETLEINTDVVYVQGTWVYDPLHEGWNEIHPIKVCCIVEKCDGDGTTQPTDDVILRIRDGFRVAQAEETKANQALPQHQWQAHPDLDGCADVVIT